MSTVCVSLHSSGGSPASSFRLVAIDSGLFGGPILSVSVAVLGIQLFRREHFLG